VGVVAGIQYEVGNRFDELTVTRMPFTKRGKRWKPDQHHVLVLSTGPYLHAANFISKLASFREVRIYGESFLYQVEIHFVAINIIQKPNNPFPSVIVQQALQ
jgi:hypothetical protein